MVPVVGTGESGDVRWGLVTDPRAMAHAFAEPGYGTVVRVLAKTVSNVGTFRATPFIYARS